MNKRKIIILSIIIIILILFIIIIQLNITKLRNINAPEGKKEIINGLTYQIYSNENDIIKLIVRINDEQGIEKISYLNGTRQINANGKQTIGIDLVVELDNEYIFDITKIDGSQEQKKFTLTSEEYNKDFINIEISSETEFGTEADLNITYDDFFKYKEYKIGENGEWKSYTDHVALNSYTIIKNSSYNKEDNTLTIYARGRDNANNIVLFSKKINCLDFDLAKTPTIVMNLKEQYIRLTGEGPRVNSTVTINFDTREDITNYYSTDGKEWKECNNSTMPLQYDRLLIYVKSVKNSSKLTTQAQGNVSANAASNEHLASNATPYGLFDGSRSTYIQIRFGDSRVNYYVNIDSSAYGKKLNVDLQSWAGDDWQNTFYFYNKNNSILSSWKNNPNMNKIQTFTIPNESAKFMFSSRVGMRVYDLSISQ